MKKILKKIAQCDKLIAENENAIETAPQLPFYKLYAKDGELEKDITEFQERIKEQLNKKFVLLENLQAKIEREKADVSYKQREITINKMSIAS